MRTMAERWTRGLAVCFSRVLSADPWRTAVLVVAAVLIGSVTAEAQISVEFAEGSLAPAAEEMGNAGVDGSPGTMATMIEIAQRYGFGYGISPTKYATSSDRVIWPFGRLTAGCSMRDTRPPCASVERLPGSRGCMPPEPG